MTDIRIGEILERLSRIRQLGLGPEVTEMIMADIDALFFRIEELERERDIGGYSATGTGKP